MNRHSTANGIHMLTLTNLFLDELADRYDAEKRLLIAIPGMIKAATCALLQKLLQTHLKETERHVKALENVFGSFCERPRSKKCEATIGLLREGDELAMRFKGPAAIDAGIISITQRIKIYQIRSYACLRNHAALLENHEASGLLKAILGEEEAASHAFGDLARSHSKGEAHDMCAGDRPGTNGRAVQPGTRRPGVPFLSIRQSRSSVLTN